MTRKKTKLGSVVDAIAMPPLKMTLVHAGNERANGAGPLPPPGQAFEAATSTEAKVDPESIKKIIEHLNKKE